MTDEPIILRASGIRHTYHDGRVDYAVLHGIDLEIRRGEFVMIMGPSGCGKTTLLNVLGLMMPPTEGRLHIDGQDAGGMSDAQRTAWRRLHIGFVFQRFNLLPVLTAEQNVALPLRLRGEGVNGQALDVLNRVGMAHRRHAKPGALSIGEQQRVAIARAVVGRPMLLFADEPTGNLDTGNSVAILDLLTDLNRSSGLTLLMITHNEHLADRADRVLRMRDGRWTSEGSHAI